MLESLAKNWWLMLLRGIVAILFGVLAFVWPGVTLLTLVLFYGAYALVDGALAIGAAVAGPGTAGPRWWLAVVGVLGVAAGLLTFLWPGITAIVLLYFIAGWAIATGVFEIVGAIRLRKEIDNEWMLILSGVLSVLFGAILIISPGAGALALIWVIGTYAILAGIIYIILAFKLHQHDPGRRQTPLRLKAQRHRKSVECPRRTGGGTTILPQFRVHQRCLDPCCGKEVSMAQKVLVLLGTKKGAFILEGDATRRSLALRGPFCENWPMNHVVGDPATRHDLCRRRQRMVRPGGVEVRPISARPGPIPARASPTRPAKSRSRRCGAWRQRRHGSMPACSRPGCSAATTAANPGSMSTGLRKHPTRPNWQPGGAGLILHSLVLHPRRPESRSGSASRRPACSTPPMAARPGSRATAAPAPISCPRTSAIRNSANACTAW